MSATFPAKMGSNIYTHSIVSIITGRVFINIFCVGGRAVVVARRRTGERGLICE